MKIGVNEAMCSGCRSCEIACSLVKYKQVNPRKAALRIVEVPLSGRYRVKMCTLCGVCAEACPQQAIYMEGDGYQINPDLCTGCGICIEECPEGVIFTHKDVEIPIVCNLCGECMKFCSPRALYDKADLKTG